MKLSLAENLRALMVRHLFEKITIKQICDETGVIRATFYNYFDDKYDCLNWIVWHDLVEPNLERLDENDFRLSITETLKIVDANRAFYKAAYNVTGQNSFEDMVRNNLTILLKEYFERHRRKDFFSNYSNEILARYYAECLAMDIRVFVKTQGSTVEETSQMAVDLMKNSFFDFIS